MFRFLPYLAAVSICINVVVIVYVSYSTTFQQTMTEPSVQKYYNKKLLKDSVNNAVEIEKETILQLSAKRYQKQLNKASFNVTPHYLRKIPVMGEEFYKPLDLYKSDDHVEKFTIVIQTYNRTDLLIKILNHFSAVHEVDRIIVVWNNIGITPPYDLWDSLGPHPTEVIFLEQQVNKVRNRLQRFAEIRTEAVLMLDDDHLYATKDVEFAFRVWKQNRNKLVGFFARKHVELSNGVLVYGDIDMNSGTSLGGYVYSLILIGATFLHHDYLEMFNSDKVPYGVHQMIDQKENCDDIAFNFLVGRHLAMISGSPQCVGLYVYPMITKKLEAEAVSGYVGKWRDPLHFAIRSQCINTLAKLYSGIPLQYCDTVLTAFSDFTRLRERY